MRRFSWIVLGLLLVWPAVAFGESHESEAAPSTEMESEPNVPFQRFWVRKDFDLDQWTKITIARVNVDHVAKQKWWQERVGGQLRPQDLGNLADYARMEFEVAFTNAKNGDRVAYSPDDGPKTLRLETAIVEVTPTRIVSAVVPGAQRGGAAMEGRLVDSVSGEVLAKFADRRSARHRLVNVDVDWNSGAKDVIETWAADIARAVNSGRNANFDDSWDFTLRPW